MLDISGSIIVGVVSGIITSSLIWLVVILFRKVFLPWYQSCTYQGLKISGTWVGMYSEPYSVGGVSTTDDPDYTISIRQSGHTVSGSIIRNKTQNKERDVKEFTFQGVFRDGNLVVRYVPKDETRLGLGSFVMMLTNDGRTFEGRSVFVASNNRAVSDFGIKWTRKVN